MTETSKSTPLKVLIVGAGIGGLTAALGLRQQGHDVTLFERSQLAKETGAAIHLAPNCHGILRRFGVLPETFGANPVNGVVERDASGNLKFDIDLREANAIWQHPWMLSHRVQLHEELKRIATSTDGSGTPAVLRTSSAVVDCDPDTATVKLEDGSSFSGDLVLGADGVSSITRQIVAGPNVKLFGSGKSAFRFMIPCGKIRDNPTTEGLLSRDGYLSMWMGDDRRLIMYPCSNNTVMNFVGIHPSGLSAAAKEDSWGRGGSKEFLLEIYKDFEPKVRSLLGLVESSELKVWTLLDMDRIPSWFKGRLALLGDAAHPFLPHQGQGGGIAIEDAASLCALLPPGTKTEDIPERLSLYEKLRDERAHKIQEFTRQAGKDLNAKNRGDFNIMEFTNYNFGHDEWHNSTRALKEHLWSRNGSLHWRSPLSFGPMPSPRQDHYGRRIPSQDSRFTTYSVRFKSSATYLKTLFPTSSFSLSKPGTVAEASFQCTELKGLKWLGGGGYKFFGLWIHGVQYQRKDGSKLRGSFLAVLLESLADPIITGREELGMPKIYCDIDVENQESTTNIRCSWRGTEFVNIAMDGLGRGASLLKNGDVKQSPASPASPDEGTFVYRYVPAVGKRGVADAAYPVFFRNGSARTPPEVEKVTLADGAQLGFSEGNWDSLPTLHHIATGFSEIPVYEILESKVEEGRGGDDISHAERIE